MDLRVDLILRVENDHGMRKAATSSARGGEQWACRCGVEFKGDGALSKGRRHHAEVILSALDEAAVSA
jgi:hypothetical protein